jgi:transposase InsO family protein
VPTCLEMKVDDRRKYLSRTQDRYLAAARRRKSELLAEMEAVTGLHRKSLVRLLGAPSLQRQRRQVERGVTYGVEVQDIVRVVWESLDYVCAQRLAPSLLPTARHLASFGELRLPEEVAALLGQISRPTVQRMLTKFSQDSYRLPRRGPERANHLTREIPMGRIPWDTTEPGHFEVDLVHHCGNSADGQYVHSLQMIDVALGWSERVAVLGRGQRAMEEGFRRIQARLPYPIRQLHPDNGSEFLNNHLVRFFGETISGLKLSRSRPWQKNDNRFVEQKNDTLVRAYFGNERLDTSVQCAAMNVIYDQMWVYYNLFQPVLHLVSKEVIEGKVKRKWDEAKTPNERLLATGVLTDESQARLSLLYVQTNPRQLRQRIYELRDALWDQPQVVAAIGGMVDPTDGLVPHGSLKFSAILGAVKGGMNAPRP